MLEVSLRACLKRIRFVVNSCVIPKTDSKCEISTGCGVLSWVGGAERARFENRICYVWFSWSNDMRNLMEATLPSQLNNGVDSQEVASINSCAAVITS